MTYGFFSPLPPARTGVADYSAALLAEMRRHGAIDANRDADVNLYHIGNNSLHREIYRRALAKPGVAVLHDAVLNHFFLGTLDRDAYVAEFIFNYGEWTRDLAETLWRQRPRSAADPRYFEYPMLKRIAECSRAVIVHNPAAARAVERHAPRARIFEIPHLFLGPPPPDPVETLRFRESLGLKPRTLLVGVFGHLRETKRLPAVLRAMQQAWKTGADARLLIAGAFASTDLERSVAPFLNDPQILRRAYLPEPDFSRHLAATDLCMNLRYPTAAESSGIAIRMMGIGKAVAFTDGEEIARIPPDACIRIAHGAVEEEMLTAAIVWLAADREAALEIGSRAARHIAKEHGVEKVALQFWSALKSVQ